jgi:hypothetical protein
MIVCQWHLDIPYEAALAGVSAPQFRALEAKAG